MPPQYFHFLRFEQNISYSYCLSNSCLNFRKIGSDFFPFLNSQESFGKTLDQLKAIKQLDNIRNLLRLDKGLIFENKYEQIFTESSVKGRIQFLKILYKTLVFIIISDHPNCKTLLKICQEILMGFDDLFEN